MRRFMVIAIPIVTLIVFILIMLSGSILKSPLGQNDDVPKVISEITKEIKNERWEEVSKKTEELDELWRKIVNRVQFSSERDEINYFSMNIARLRGAIMAKDKGNALVEINEAYEHWDELGN